MTDTDKPLLGQHSTLLHTLDNQEIIKSIILPPVIQASESATDKASIATIPTPAANNSYAMVGIIDTGVGGLDQLKEWRIGGCDYLEFEFNQDYSHGTFIAGLISGGDTLNTYAQLQESKCKFYDLDLHPTDPSIYGSYYPNGFIDFLEQLDHEIVAAKNLGVRIFNMSLAVTTCVQDNNYSLFASILDKIADKHDVIFVLPSGNLNSNIFRSDWSSTPTKTLEMLASYKNPGPIARQNSTGHKYAIPL